MSRNSDAKKARRRKRQAVRGPRPTVTEQDTEYAEIADAVAQVNSWLVGRGWALDEETSGDDLLNWVYPPSAADVEADSGAEPVTRIWITLQEDDDEFVLEFGAVLVGAGAGDGTFVLDPETLPDQIEAIEAYRIGSDPPDLDG